MNNFFISCPKSPTHIGFVVKKISTIQESKCNAWASLKDVQKGVGGSHSYTTPHYPISFLIIRSNNLCNDDIFDGLLPISFFM
jgi:hypothetical protein